MLPKLLQKIELPFSPSASTHFYVVVNDVDLDQALDSPANQGDTEIESIGELRALQGDASATAALVLLINQRKFQAFKRWQDMLERDYPQQPTFHLLLMRPLFELSGRGVRRPVIEPDAEVVDWLYRKIESGRLWPNENLAKQYCAKLGMGAQAIPENGWQFIPAGVQHAAQLAANCRGSGWCIAGVPYSTHYLKNCDFYLLRANRQPVVALCVEAGSKLILECRGRFNSVPADWLTEIALFATTLQLQFTETFVALLTPEDVENWPMSEWLTQLNYWPFALVLAPNAIKDELMPKAQSAAHHYAHFNGFQPLAAEIGLAIDADFWKVLLESNPNALMTCPADLKDDPAIREACIAGWIAMVEQEQLTAQGLASLPAFVKASADFLEGLSRSNLQFLRDAVKKFPTTLFERTHRVRWQDALPAIAGEPPELARERMVSVLLTNEDGVFSDAKFGELDCRRDDFSELRAQAWREAIQMQPPLWFELPANLMDREALGWQDSAGKNVDVESWRKKVLNKPWLLTQQSGVPKSIRLNRQILEAYREGWLRHLRVYPWRLWVSINPRRVYMPNGLLADSRTLTALTQGWMNDKKKIVDCWFQYASERMRELPAIQLSILQAICPPHLAGLYTGGIKICLDIYARRRKHFTANSTPTPLDAKISLLLALRGFRIPKPNE